MSIELPSIMGFPLSDDKIAFTCRLEAALKQASDEKKEMEAQVSEFSLKIENLENGMRSF